MSNPLDSAKQARMQEIITDVVGKFGASFTLAYKDALIDKIKVSFVSFLCLRY